MRISAAPLHPPPTTTTRAHAQSAGVLPPYSQVYPWIQQGVAAFGYPRSLFAGNWFFVNWASPPLLGVYGTWAGMVTQALTDMGASTAQAQQLLHDTAVAAYRL
jgi:predicted TIM-barrel fold metal-dependent hydrolase